MFERGSRRAVAAVVGLLALSACERPARVHEPRAARVRPVTVRVGICASLTGAHAAVGRALRAGLEAGFEQKNRTEPTTPVQVQCTAYDDQSRESAAARACERLVREDGVALVVGGFDPEQAEALATVVPGGLIVCATCPAPGTAHVVGLAPSAHERAELLAELVVRTMRIERVDVLVRAEAAVDRALADAFADSFAARGGRTRETIAFTAESITDAISRVLSDPPQAVLVALDGREAALVGRALRRRAVPSALLLAGTPDLSVLPEADRKAALEGALFPALFGTHSQPVLDYLGEREQLGFTAAERVCQALAQSPTREIADLRVRLEASRLAAPLQIMQVRQGELQRLVP